MSTAYWDAYNATRAALVDGPVRAFSLECIAPLEHWATATCTMR